MNVSQPSTPNVYDAHQLTRLSNCIAWIHRFSLCPPELHIELAASHSATTYLHWTLHNEWTEYVRSMLNLNSWLLLPPVI